MPARIAAASKSTGISIQVPLRCLILSLFGKRQRMVQGDTDWSLNIPPHFVFCYLFHLPCRVTFLFPHSRWYQVTVEEYEVITVDGVTFLKAVQSRCKYIHIYCMSCLYCSMIRCFYWLLARRISLKLGRVESEEEPVVSMLSRLKKQSGAKTKPHSNELLATNRKNWPCESLLTTP